MLEKSEAIKNILFTSLVYSKIRSPRLKKELDELIREEIQTRWLKKLSA